MPNQVYVSIVQIPLTIVTNGNQAENKVFYLISSAFALKIDSTNTIGETKLLCLTSQNLNESSKELVNRINNEFSNEKIQIMSWKINGAKIQNNLYPVNNNFISDLLQFIKKECFVSYISQDNIFDIENIVFQITEESDLVIDNSETNLTDIEIQYLQNNDCSFFIMVTSSYIEFLKGQCHYKNIYLLTPVDC